MNLQFFAEIYDEPRKAASPHDRLAEAEKHLERCWCVLADEVECKNDIGQCQRKLWDVMNAQKEVDKLTEECDRADEYASERMCRHESV